MLLWRTWQETPCTPRRRFAHLTCKFVCTRRCYHTKTGVHLREHRSNLHVMWSSDPVRLRETLDAVLGDACKEQRFQLGSALAKDQSLTEDALTLIKTAFVAA